VARETVQRVERSDTGKRLGVRRRRQLRVLALPHNIAAAKGARAARVGGGVTVVSLELRTLPREIRSDYLGSPREGGPGGGREEKV
jgi:hypothetical protein